jgi:hypothetical protein
MHNLSSDVPGRWAMSDSDRNTRIKGQGYSMIAAILEQIHFLTELVATDQKSVDAISARLVLYQKVFQKLTADLEAQEILDAKAKDEEHN